MLIQSFSFPTSVVATRQERLVCVRISLIVGGRAIQVFARGGALVRSKRNRGERELNHSKTEFIFRGDIHYGIHPYVWLRIKDLLSYNSMYDAIWVKFVGNQAKNSDKI